MFRSRSLRLPVCIQFCCETRLRPVQKSQERDVRTDFLIETRDGDFQNIFVKVGSRSVKTRRAGIGGRVRIPVWANS